MVRLTIVGILLCLVAFQSSFCAPSADDKVVTPEGDKNPQPSPKTTTAAPTSTSSEPPTTTPPKPTTPTTVAPSTKPTPAPTEPPTEPTKPSPTTKPTTPTTTPTPTPTTDAPTTEAPKPSPSDRKFDAFSFLGGFALGLGLVAIGILSWKFYLSRQENYYHTL